MASGSSKSPTVHLFIVYIYTNVKWYRYSPDDDTCLKLFMHVAGRQDDDAFKLKS